MSSTVLERTAHADSVARIGTKTVQLSRPYRPGERSLGGFIGRDRELEMVTAAWLGGPHVPPLSPLLLGEPGVGKSRMVYELARRMGRDLYIFQGHEDVTAEDLACAVRFSDESKVGMDYVLSPLVTAMKLGQICFIDEIAKIRPRALALLVSVLDERRYIDSTLLGERVEASRGFRFVAATNTADLEAESMPEFLRSRMRPVISVGFPQQAELSKVVQSRFTELGPSLESLLRTFWALWADSGADSPPTARDALQLFNLASSLAQLEDETRDPGGAFDGPPGQLALGVSLPLTPAHLRVAFGQLFQDLREGGA